MHICSGYFIHSGERTVDCEPLVSFYFKTSITTEADDILQYHFIILQRKYDFTFQINRLA